MNVFVQDLPPHFVLFLAAMLLVNFVSRELSYRPSRNYYEKDSCLLFHFFINMHKRAD
jgi:hypothetical protein